MKCVCKLHTLNKKCSLEKEAVIVLATRYTGIMHLSRLQGTSPIEFITS